MSDQRTTDAPEEIEQLRAENKEMRQQLIRVSRLSAEALDRPSRTLTVYELNRALRGIDV